MKITVTELRKSLGKYLVLAETQDIHITKNGKLVAKLSNPYEDRIRAAKSLFGSLPSGIDLEKVRAERLAEK